MGTRVDGRRQMPVSGDLNRQRADEQMHSLPEVEMRCSVSLELLRALGENADALDDFGRCVSVGQRV